ncbi:MAG: tripartite tricarboxylate transporter substrate binding protein [Burkholderiales bacterium]|jgi:tripartite-type tricarboxylate transporter receptor subunit TctC|nr:tripartite tricarboxylate transporter substrate binding protein [Burkholderiales bacterium]
MPSTMNRACVLLAATLSGLASMNLSAQAYPVKPIRVIVPFPPGGGNDVIARVVALRLTDRVGQTVVVENRAGANGMLGLEVLAKSAPDGYTIGTGAAGPMAVNPSLYEKIPYDPVRDFAPITNMVNFPLLLVAHPSLPVRTVRDLIALARSRPDQISYASPGSGNSGHLAGELFNFITKLRITHVPYKGAGPAVQDLVGGHVQLMFSSIPSVLPFIEQKRLTAVAVGNLKRIPSLPNVPTIAESGVPGYEAYSWVGMVAPANTPRDVVGRLNREIVGILQQKDTAEKLTQQGAIPDFGTPEQFAAYIKAEIEKWGAIVRQAKIRAD